MSQFNGFIKEVRREMPGEPQSLEVVIRATGPFDVEAIKALTQAGKESGADCGHELRAWMKQAA